MARALDQPIERHNVALFKGQWEQLSILFGNNIGNSAAIRKLIQHFLRNVEAKTAAAVTMEDLKDD